MPPKKGRKEEPAPQVQSQSALTEEQRIELSEAFKLFDNDGDEHMGAEELHVVLLAIGRVMPLSEVTKVIVRTKQHDELGNHKPIAEDDEHAEELNFQEFIRLMSKEMLDTDVTEELIEAFKEFGVENEDDGMNFQQMKSTMQRYGEKMTDAEYQLLFDETDHDNDRQINFMDFMRMMMSK